MGDTALVTLDLSKLRIPSNAPAGMLEVLAPEHAPALFAISREADVLRWTFVPRDWRLEGANTWAAGAMQALQNGTSATFACLTPERVVAGIVGLTRIDWRHRSAEIYYWLGAVARGRGIASTAIEAVSRWALLDAELERIACHIEPDNVSSLRAAEAAGFKREGLLRSYFAIRNTRADVLILSRVRSDLAAAPE